MMSRPQHALFWSILIMILALLYAYTPWVTPHFAGTKAALWMSSLPWWTMLLLWFIYTKHPRTILPLLLRGAVVLYMLLLLLSTIFSVQPLESLLGNIPRHQGTIMNMSYLLIAYLTASYWPQQQTLRWLSYLLYGAVPLAALALVQQLPLVSYLPEFMHLPTLYLERSFGTVSHPTILALVMGTFALMSIALFQKTNLYRWLTLAILFFAAVLASGTKSIILLTFLFLPLLCWQRKGALVTGTLTILMSIFGLLAFIHTPYHTTDYSHPFRSIHTRIALTSMSMDAIHKQPLLGYGPEMQQYVLPQLRTPLYDSAEGTTTIPERAHNELLDIALTSGVGAALIVIVGWIYLMRRYNNTIITIPLLLLSLGLLFHPGSTLVYVLLWAYAGLLTHQDASSPV